MLKIFVTGDNHIGLKYASHIQKEKIISERINAILRMVEKANSEGCGLFAVTGDLFENINTAKKDVKAVVEILSKFNGMTAVIPGNHDYYGDGVKVWQYFKECSDSCGSIALLNERRPYEFSIGDDEVIIYPAFCGSLHSKSGENNLGWIKDEPFPDDGKYRIGIAHGAVEGESLDKEGVYFLMPREELYRIPVDVWLVGHTHVPFPNDLSENFSAVNERIFNAGTHVQTDVSNNTEGLCFILEIDENKNIRAKKYISGGLRFYRRNVSVSAGNFSGELLRCLSDIPDLSVVDILIGGAVSEDEYSRRTEIIEDALSRFLEGSYNSNGLTRLITKELIDKEFPETSFSAGFLTDLLADPKEAQLAYELLQSVRGERQ